MLDRRHLRTTDQVAVGSRHRRVVGRHHRFSAPYFSSRRDSGTCRTTMEMGLGRTRATTPEARRITAARQRRTCAGRCSCDARVYRRSFSYPWPRKRAASSPLPAVCVTCSVCVANCAPLQATRALSRVTGNSRWRFHAQPAMRQELGGRQDTSSRRRSPSVSLTGGSRRHAQGWGSVNGHSHLSALRAAVDREVTGTLGPSPRAPDAGHGGGLPRRRPVAERRWCAGRVSSPTRRD